MNAKRNYDPINAELSKTYFGKNPKQVNPSSSKRAPAPKPNFIVIISAVVLLIFLVFGALVLVVSSGISSTRPSTNENTKTAGPRKLQPDTIAISEAIKSSPEAIEKIPVIFYNFEEDSEGWGIPAWALDKPDHVAVKFEQVTDMASEGTGSMKLSVSFPGGEWTGALVEIVQYLDIGDYDQISADIYLPETCPKGLRAKFIVTVGKDWRFVEMSRSFRLTPGKWTTISADLSEESYDWRRTVVDMDFKTDVRKLAIRIESDKKPAYTGPIYIDNITLWESKK